MLSRNESERGLFVKVSDLFVVVAEDEAINRLYLTRVLQSAGLKVVAVKDGVLAYDAAMESERPDFILMDLTMPRLNGLEASSRIRSAEAERALKNVPIIALTAHARAEDRKACADAGMNGFLMKPLAEKELWEEIKRVLEKS